MNKLKSEISAYFEIEFGAQPKFVVRAPGRVNLIGEHIDYNGGLVLPCAIGFHTYVGISRRKDSIANLASKAFGDQRVSFDLAKKIRPVAGTESWANYARGVIAGISEYMPIPGGFDIAIMGDLPQGAGLSSSASLEIAIGFAVCMAFGFDISLFELARIGQMAEHDFAGCNCGLMDQMASALGKSGHATLIDCYNLEYSNVPIAEDIAICIVHSGVKRELVEGKYNERRNQCEAARQFFELDSLRYLTADHFAESQKGLDEKAFTRARHVFTENQRVSQMLNALPSSNFEAIGAILAQSHFSMRDDFEITVPKVDELVQTAQSIIGESGGARMTGGGFGGAIVAMMPSEKYERFERQIHENYRTPQNDAPLIHRIDPANGVELI